MITIGEFATGLLRGGMADSEVLKAVLVAFPNAKTTKACIAWYKSKMKKAGKPFGTQQDASKCNKTQQDASKCNKTQQAPKPEPKVGPTLRDADVIGKRRASEAQKAAIRATWGNC